MNIYTEMLKQYPEPNSSMLHNFSDGIGFSFDAFFSHQQPEFPTTYVHQKISSTCPPDIFSTVPIVNFVVSNHNVVLEKRKEMEQSSSRSCKSNSLAASTSSVKKRYSSGRCKNGKNKQKEMDKLEEVVHVRAKRGQATDSHSIAERVRREKIKSKLRCLQELVPGCHKSMGMAVILEEIINYVHSLQKQVEFLSMELEAASSAHDLNVDSFLSRKFEGTNSPEVQDIQKWPRERYGKLSSCLYPTWSN